MPIVNMGPIVKESGDLERRIENSKNIKICICFDSLKEYKEATKYLKNNKLRYYPIGLHSIQIEEKYLESLQNNFFKFKRTTLTELYNDKELKARCIKEIEEKYQTKF